MSPFSLFIWLPLWDLISKIDVILTKQIIETLQLKLLIDKSYHVEKLRSSITNKQSKWYMSKTFFDGRGGGVTMQGGDKGGGG